MLATIIPMYIHSLDPFAIQFTQSFGIRWYGLAYLAGFLLGYWLIQRLAKRGQTFLRPVLISDFVFTIALGTVIGGRLGFCLFYEPGLFFRISSTFPFWGVLEVHKGGMASHGGIVGIILACFWFGRKHGLPFSHLMDLTTLGGSLGIFFGRIANFINGELVGRPCADTLPWAVKFPQDIILWPQFEPHKLLSLGPVVSKIGVNVEKWREIVIQNPLRDTVNSILNQIILAVQTGNTTTQVALSPLLTPRHPSQLYEALLEGLLLFLIVSSLWKRKFKSPGVITGWFLVLYSLVRIVGEQFRLPDAFIGFQWLGLTRGQWLSFGLGGVGLVVLRWAWRNKEKIGVGVD